MPGPAAEARAAIEAAGRLPDDELDLAGLTLVGQDWGALTGLRLVGEHPDRFDLLCEGLSDPWVTERRSELILRNFFV